MAETAAYGLMLGDGKSKRTVSELHLNDVPQRTAG
jgi:hypothetical protein